MHERPIIDNTIATQADQFASANMGKSANTSSNTAKTSLASSFVGNYRYGEKRRRRPINQSDTRIVTRCLNH